MKAKDFGDIIEKRIEFCKSTLLVKSEEYATDNDKLHNFKVAAELQGVNTLTALVGMMAKHTISVYDLVKKAEAGELAPQGIWDEKIGDHINYLLLLDAAVREQRIEQTRGESVHNCLSEFVDSIKKD